MLLGSIYLYLCIGIFEEFFNKPRELLWYVRSLLGVQFAELVSCEKGLF